MSLSAQTLSALRARFGTAYADAADSTVAILAPFHPFVADHYADETPTGPKTPDPTPAPPSPKDPCAGKQLQIQAKCDEYCASQGLCTKECKGTAKNGKCAVYGSCGDCTPKKGPQSFVLPGLLKINVVKVPAKPKRKGINPFTKEEQWFAAKPATVKIKVRPLKKLKDFAA